MTWWKHAAPALTLACTTTLAVDCSRPSNKGPDPAGSTAAAASAGAHRKGTRAERVAQAANTRDMLTALSKDCLTCAETSGCLDPAQHGGLCETVAGQAKGGGTEAALCLDALRCVFTSKCANTGEQSACLCGKTDIQ